MKGKFKIGDIILNKWAGHRKPELVIGYKTINRQRCYVCIGVYYGDNKVSTSHYYVSSTNNEMYELLGHINIYSAVKNELDGYYVPREQDYIDYPKE